MKVLQTPTSFPFEIWHECFQYLDDISDQENLSLTSQLLRNVSLPFIYKSRSFSLHISLGKNDPPSVMDEQLVQLQEDIAGLRALAKSQTFAPLVRKFTFSYSLYIAARADEEASDAGRKAYAPFVNALSESLPHFVNVSKVEVKEFRVKMDKKILVALSRLPLLEDVSMRLVRFGVHLLKQRLPLRRLVINNVPWDANPNPASHLLDIISGQRLESLDVTSPAYSPKLIRALTKQGLSLRLKTLSFKIASAHIADVYDFLASCPNLERIQIEFTEGIDVTNPDTLPPLPPSSVPRLQAFSGPLVTAEAIVPGRPVRDVSLQGKLFHSRLSTDHMDDLLSWLSNSTGPIIRLDMMSLNIEIEALGLIESYLPSLEELIFPMEDQKIFPGEDPQALQQVPGTETDSANPYVYDSVKGLLNQARLSLIHVHTDYMHVLHWAARKRLTLPGKIETLFLYCELPFFLEDDAVTDNSGEEARFIEEHGRPYTDSKARDIFDGLSIIYPRLQTVIVGENDRDKVQWAKDDDGNWKLVSMI